ncbi:hypothetical protein A1O3_06092 [Capronia epimyces CBS 606.96]|uniref:Alpha box domain-containing protein n=1 Tax=Capronia epimyces CBS 606.96 TaxID=1182542 RepID=W9YJ08_9EURO|nr:uncharacterized protein A1O3_06092 [Capronia epimyces CBS 606.96]EXJ82279.1 hypothetical protein A1O3_06092 [Capronia epimyces CBS 606.96]
MAVNMNSSQASLANAISSLNPAQLSALTASVAAAAGAQNTPPVTAGAMGAAVNLPQSTLPTVQASSNLPGNRRGSTAVRKKPLNAFITYRTYYSPLFKGLTQKEKSGLLRVMWSADLKKPMWELLGHAYSDLRDHHDETLPVDKFLAVSVPLLPVVAADQYISKMGWELTKNPTGETTLTRSESFNADKVYAEYPAQTNLSMADVVNHCYNEGLLKRGARRSSPRLRPGRRAQVSTGNSLANAASGGSIILAVAPQPVSSPLADATTSTATAPTANRAVESETESGSETGEPRDSQARGDEEERVLGQLSVEDITQNPAYLSIQHITTDQQAAFDGYALALHFHPNIQPPILGFDPRIIQDDFDPFDLDLSALINWKA